MGNLNNFKKMKIKLKTLLLLKLAVIIMVWGLIFAQNSFAWEKAFDRETLSPAMRFDAQSFLDIYSRTYGNTDIDLQYEAASTEEVQIGRQDFLEKAIRENLEKKSEYSRADKELFEKVLKLAKKEYAGKKFSSPSNEFFLHHTLEAAYSLSEWGAPVEAIAAALLHRLNENGMVEVLKNKLSEKELDEISTLIHNFLFVTDFYYASLPLEGAVHDIQNFMNAIIQLSAKDRGNDNDTLEPDYRIMLLVFADKLASIQFASEIDRNDLIKEIEEMYAPLADRLGYVEIKKQLLNESFRLSRNAEYNYTRKIFKEHFGREYEEMKEHLNAIEDMLQSKIIQKYGLQRAATFNISARLKGLYEIAEKLKDVNYIEGMQDILGIRILCDCTPEMLYQYSDLVAENLGSWVKKKYDQRNWEVPTKRPQGALYIDLKKEDTIDGYSYEVQIMTKQFHDQRERERAHWSYKLAKNTGQKFDQTEMYAPTENFESDFNRVFRELKDWVFVFVQKEGKGGRHYLTSKRLPKGSIVADIAALRSTNLLNDRFSGANIYDWNQGVFYLRSAPDSRGLLATIDYTLLPGDILVIENNGRIDGSQILRLREKTKTLRAQMIISLIELEKKPPSILNKNFPLSGEISLKNKFKEAGIVFDNNLKLGKFLDSFAHSQGLINREELYAALTYCSWKISISKIIEEAKLKGKEMLEEKFIEEESNLDDFALGQLARSFGIDSRDIFYLLLGTGQISDWEIELKRHKINNKPNGVLNVYLSKLFQFTVTVPREHNRKNISSQRIKKLVDKIENILDEKELKDSEERIRLPKFKGKGDDIVISFSARASTEVKAIELQRDLMSAVRIKGKQVEFEEFYNGKKKVCQWEMVLQFANYGQDVSELTQYLIDEIKSWSPLSNLIKFNVEEDITTDGLAVIEVRAIVATDINHSSIVLKITKLKNNRALTFTSSATIYEHSNVLQTFHESSFSSVNSSI